MAPMASTSRVPVELVFDSSRVARLAKMERERGPALQAAAHLISLLASPHASPADIAKAARAASRSGDALYTAAAWVDDT